MNWQKRGNVYSVADVATQAASLPCGVFKIIEDPRGVLHLELISDLEMPKKVYGLEQRFVNRVLRYFNSNSRKTVAALLSGVQGAGKTVTAKSITIGSGLPVILMDSTSGGYFEFINSIPQDVAILFDELEKVYANATDATWVPLLSTLDGTNTGNYRRLWIMTCNGVSVSPFILDRIGRVRYHKQFKGLDREQISLIIKDRLPEIKEEDFKNILKALLLLRNRTVDAVVGYCDEVLLLGTSDAAVVMEDFNLARSERKFRFYARPLREDGTPSDCEPSVLWDCVEGARGDIRLLLSKTGQHISHKFGSSSWATVIGNMPSGSAVLQNHSLQWAIDDAHCFLSGLSPRWASKSGKRPWTEVKAILDAEAKNWEVWYEETDPDDPTEPASFDYSIYAIPQTSGGKEIPEYLLEQDEEGEE